MDTKNKNFPCDFKWRITDSVSIVLLILSVILQYCHSIFLLETKKIRQNILI